MIIAADTWLIASGEAAVSLSEVLEGRTVYERGGAFEVGLAGGGRARIVLHRAGEGAAFPPAAVVRGLSKAGPRNAVAWVEEHLAASRLVLELVFEARTAADADDAEALLEELRSALGGLVYFEREGFTNHEGALVALESPVGLNGKRLVATMHKGRWVEYLLDTSNPSWRKRFLEGRLPRGMA